MVRRLYVREMSDEERARVERAARSQKAPVRLARRARIIQRSAEGLGVSAIALEVSVGQDVVRHWIHCFNEHGFDALDDAFRSGRTPTYTEEERGRVIAKARGLPPKPEEGEVATTCHWTLDRLQEELNREGVAIKRSQIRRILLAEHIKWQRPRSWLESDDPDFAEKRGRSSPPTPTLPRVA